MITKSIRFQYGPERPKAKKGQKVKVQKIAPPFTVAGQTFKDAEKAAEHARKLNAKSKTDIAVTDANGLTVFAITTTALAVKEQPSQPATVP